MRVFLTGGTGFIGRHLVAALAATGHECTVLSRGTRDPFRHPRVRMIRGDPTRAGDWQRALSGVDVAINLAGERLAHPLRRWTAARKQELTASRVETTRRLVAALRQAHPPPRALLSGSAVGYYGARDDAPLDETAPPGTDFLARLVVAWEEAAQAARDITRVVRLRTGLVVARDAPTITPLLPLFRLGLGGSWGDGKGWWSWIHMADVVGLVLYACDHPIEGALNLTAPNPVTVDEFTATLGAALARPVWFRMPALGLRLAMGEGADPLLHLQRVVPAGALAAGYRFRFPTLRPALDDMAQQATRPAAGSLPGAPEP